MINERNQKIIDMVIERAKRDFPDDIVLIGLTGSLSTGDEHAKSDVDLVIVNVTERGCGICDGFILDDVGYDIYCTPWSPRIEEESRLESPMVSHVVDLKILYCSKPEYLEKFNEYRANALRLLAEPIGPDCLGRADAWLAEAKKSLAEAYLTDEPGRVRYASSGVSYFVINSVVSMNNEYIRRGIKRYEDELRGYKYLPDGFFDKYHAVIRAKTVSELRDAAGTLLRSALKLHTELTGRFAPRAQATAESLGGTCEELWCNYHNKIRAAVASGDLSYVFQALMGAQNYFDEMTDEHGAKRFDVFADFDADRLDSALESFDRAERAYIEDYNALGGHIKRYESFEELYKAYMGDEN